MDKLAHIFYKIALLWFLCSAAQLYAAQPAEMLVSTDWLASHLQDSNLVILCVAENGSFYSGGHIPGARLLQISEIVTSRDGVPNQLPAPEQLKRSFEAAGISNNSRVVLYGERQGVMAARAYFTMDYLGVADRASLLDGGIEKWRAEGRSITKETPHISAGRLQIHPHPQIVADSIQVKEYSESTAAHSAVLLDARPPAEYSGRELSEDVSQPGHIPGAQNLFWQDLLREENVPVLLPKSELQRKFESAGAAPGQQVITYCRTGMQSSFDYFVAKYLGYPVRMYVASFFAWSKSLPAAQSGSFCH